jgi:hypothetical protein
MTDNTRIEEILEKGPEPDNNTITSVVYQKETADDLLRLTVRIDRFVKESFVPAYEHASDLVRNEHPRFKGRVLNPWFVHSLQVHLSLLSVHEYVTKLLDSVGKDRMLVTLALKGETLSAGRWPVSPKGSIVVETFNNVDRYPSDGKPKKSGIIQAVHAEIPLFLTM